MIKDHDISNHKYTCWVDQALHVDTTVAIAYSVGTSTGDTTNMSLGTFDFVTRHTIRSQLVSKFDTRRLRDTLQPFSSGGTIGATPAYTVFVIV
jgi:hypothetical protein